MMLTKRLALLFLAVVFAFAWNLRCANSASRALSPHFAQAAEQNTPAKKVCEVATPTASFSIPYVAQPPQLNTHPHSATWAHAASTWIEKDCTHQLDYPKLKTEVRAFWTSSDLYLLFI